MLKAVTVVSAVSREASGRFTVGQRVKNYIISRIVLESSTIAGDSPVGENHVTLEAFPK